MDSLSRSPAPASPDHGTRDAYRCSRTQDKSEHQVVAGSSPGQGSQNAAKRPAINARINMLPRPASQLNFNHARSLCFSPRRSWSRELERRSPRKRLRMLAWRGRANHIDPYKTGRRRWQLTQLALEHQPAPCIQLAGVDFVLASHLRYLGTRRKHLFDRRALLLYSPLAMSLAPADQLDSLHASTHPTGPTSALSNIIVHHAAIRCRWTGQHRHHQSPKPQGVLQTTLTVLV